ncbi:head morphogenesis domain protein [Vibrio phage 1.214.O._10N.222.54.F11]|nr:head morphogenesis domain protein [Vibrio phage 1.214.O._10N.222.54.F11]
MKVKSLKPVLPTDKRDPVGAMNRVIASYKQIDKRLKNIYSKLSERIEQIPRERVALNNIGSQSYQYRYLVDAAGLQDIGTYLQQLIYDEILGTSNGSFSNLWFMNPYVEEQYERATEQALQSTMNLASSDAVGADLSRQIRGLQAEFVLMSPGYQTRVNLVKNRLFEEMKGFSDDMKRDLGGTLGRGMAAGHGINRIKKDVRERLGVSKSRAERIARTEINNAYRTAYWGETDELNDTVWKDSGFVTRMLWYSALTATTRRTHAQRHGEVYNTTEIREFYSVDANALNCLCTQVEVLVRKKTGEVININIVNDLKNQKKKYLGLKAA